MSKLLAIHIDRVIPPLNFNQENNQWLGNKYVVCLTEDEVDKINEFNFNPNTTNSRNYNTGFLAAFLGPQILDKRRYFNN